MTRGTGRAPSAVVVVSEARVGARPASVVAPAAFAVVVVVVPAAGPVVVSAVAVVVVPAVLVCLRVALEDSGAEKRASEQAPSRASTLLCEP